MTIEEKLKGKRVLFLSVRTFSYEKIIAEQLRKFGAEVDYFDERPNNSIFAKGVIRLKKTLYQQKINAYYKGILKQIRGNQYDYLFVIKGEVVPEFFLDEFKKDHKNCFNIFYTWDSLKNHSRPLEIQKYFDARFTFDNEDAKKHQMFFRPLFFGELYEDLSNSNNKFDYNLLFIGTAHTDRYIIGNALVNWCNNNNLTSYTYYYMQSRLVYFFKRIFDNSFKKIDYKKLSFKSLNTSQIIKLYQRSQVILDVNHSGQTGLTMRTFEALGAGKKLITTNQNIINYPFYNENNVLVIDRKDPKIDRDFFNSGFKPIPKELLELMSLKGWLECIFIEPQSNYWLK
jgi:hypothetical protein